MRVYVIDTGNDVPEKRRGIIGIDGDEAPAREEKIDCIETVTRLADQGWVIAVRPGTPIGSLAAQAAYAMGGSVLELDRNGRIRPSRIRVITADGLGDSIRASRPGEPTASG